MVMVVSALAPAVSSTSSSQSRCRRCGRHCRRCTRSRPRPGSTTSSPADRPMTGWATTRRTLTRIARV
uniref:Putative secreted protein n=1 Tax=Anopheles marajoara TaxID=58244 RepID=A0A2M4CGE7_9DIPT